MSKIPILTSGAPKPLPGIYSQSIVAGGLVFVSGAVPMDAETMKIIDGDIQTHTVTIPNHNTPRPCFIKKPPADNGFSTNASRISLLFWKHQARASTTSLKSMYSWLIWMILPR
jgi:hypothetical protein